MRGNSGYRREQLSNVRTIDSTVSRSDFQILCLSPTAPGSYLLSGGVFGAIGYWLVGVEERQNFLLAQKRKVSQPITIWILELTWLLRN